MKYYITTAIPYVNAKPHIGHALEFVQGDVMARYHRILGDNVTFLTGSDENALKNVQAAEKVGMSVEAFCAQNAQAFEKMAQELEVQIDVFQRSSSAEHHRSCQQLWNACLASGDIYKKTYEGLYCVGCEAFYTPEELNENGECFEHPGKKLEIVSEENYFFCLSKYAQQILALIQNDTIKIVPEKRKAEIVSFLSGEVQDISISRSKERAKNWGVPVPNDDTQIMYVWFDALNVYQSGVGYGLNDTTYNTWWPADAHLIGKGITRFHAVYWPAMLLSANLQLPKKILVHGYFTVNGQKMSKTLGNVIDPHDVIHLFGAEAVRYYLLREISTVDDGDFHTDRLRELYKTVLANDLGNLVSRVSKLSENLSLHLRQNPTQFSSDVSKHVEAFQLKEAFDDIWNRISALNQSITEKKPWTMDEKEKTEFLDRCIFTLQQIGFDLQPFLPKTAATILEHFSSLPIQPIAPMFPRIG